jgi:hypothetical protein
MATAVMARPPKKAAVQAGMESPRFAVIIALKEAPHSAVCIPNQPMPVMLINRAEIQRAPITPNPSTLTIVEGSPERELCIPIKQAQPRRIRPPVIPQKRRPPRDSPWPSIPPAIRVEILSHWPAVIKAGLPPRSRRSLSLTLNVSILFMIIFLLFYIYKAS